MIVIQAVLAPVTVLAVEPMKPFFTPYIKFATGVFVDDAKFVVVQTGKASVRDQNGTDLNFVNRNG